MPSMRSCIGRSFRATQRANPVRYAQVKGGEKLHLVYEAGEGPDPAHLISRDNVSAPLCNRPFDGHYKMTIKVSLGATCKNCLRIALARGIR